MESYYYQTFYSHGDQVEPFKLEGHQTDALTDLSLKYPNEYDSEKPWFHVICFAAPHGGAGKAKYPGHPAPPRYEDMFRPENIILRPNVAQGM